MNRGSIELARRLCLEIAGPTDEDDNEGRGYGSIDVAEILSAEIVRLREVMHETARVIAKETSVGSGAELCPNCLTPWKCNGPHLTPNTY